MRMAIVGAGISGLLAYKYFKDRPYIDSIMVYEKDRYKGMLEKHSSIFRARSKEVADVLKCTYEEVKVEKEYIGNGRRCTEPDIKMKNDYSRKVSGRISYRSIYRDRTDDERFILKNVKEIEEENLLDNIEIRGFNKGKLFLDNNTENWHSFDICISTIPLFNTLKMCRIKHDKLHFGGDSITVVTNNVLIDSDVYQTIYFTDIGFPAYRATLQKNELLIEFMTAFDETAHKVSDSFYFNHVVKIANQFGLDASHIEFNSITQDDFGKIIPMDDDQLRKKMIFDLTSRFNIYSLGRYAIWKNSVGSDEVVEDLKKIEKMILVSQADREYERRLER